MDYQALICLCFFIYSFILTAIICLGKYEKRIFHFNFAFKANKESKLKNNENEQLKELESAKRTFHELISKTNKSNEYLNCMPLEGMAKSELLELLRKYLDMEYVDWQSGSCSGCVYNSDDKLVELASQVYKMFCWSNPIHFDVFPNVRKMEAECVRWVLNMFHGDENACGTVSIFSKQYSTLSIK